MIKYIFSQIILFFFVAYSLAPLFPKNPQGWPVVAAYGSLLITPIFLSRHNLRLLLCLSACAAIWCLSRVIDLADPNYIGHVTPLYLALAFGCLFAREYVMAAFSLMLSAYGLIMIGEYSAMWADMTYAQKLGWNVIFALQLLYGGAKAITGGGDASTTEDRPAAEHREAA